MTPKLLCILDGVGLNPNGEANAVFLAQTPVLDELFKNSPNTTLITFGERVGLPEGQMGNSEVGHSNIGAGRVIEQTLVRINRELRTKTFMDIPAWKDFISNTKTVHLIGLFSEGGVHSSVEHLYLLLDNLLSEKNIKICLHLLTDGRDTPPQSAITLLSTLDKFQNIKICTVSGRYFAMDRDHRWERVEKAYRAIIDGIGEHASNAKEAVKNNYDKKVTDEFIIPTVIGDYKGISEDDSILFWNFRDDRMREISRAISFKDFSEFKRDKKISKVLCFTDYDPSLNLPVLFKPIEITKTFGEIISNIGLRQARVAETEKYPHVTFFFNGGEEKSFPKEERFLVPSPRDVATYDLKPEMSAYGVKDVVVDLIKNNKTDIIIVNFANGDMVGHTGVLPAAIKAVETVDVCLGEILTALKEKNGEALILADHGNAEQMIDYITGAPHTSHTMYPVPFIYVGDKEITLKSDGALCDVAPTLLEICEINQPAEMTGVSLILR